MELIHNIGFIVTDTREILQVPQDQWSKPEK